MDIYHQRLKKVAYFNYISFPFRLDKVIYQDTYTHHLLPHGHTFNDGQFTFIHQKQTIPPTPAFGFRRGLPILISSIHAPMMVTWHMERRPRGAYATASRVISWRRGNSHLATRSSLRRSDGNHSLGSDAIL